LESDEILSAEPARFGVQELPLYYEPGAESRLDSRNEPADPPELFRASSTVGYLYSFRLNVFEERPPQHGEIRFEVSSGGTVRYVVDEDRTFDTLTDLCGWLTDSVIQGKRTLE